MSLFLYPHFNTSSGIPSIISTSLKLYHLNPQPTPNQPQPPPQLLSELRDILLQTFRTEFDEAAIRKDEQAVSRFFRLWPGIGAEDEGLEAYGDFVVGLVKGRSSNAGKRESTS